MSCWFLCYTGAMNKKKRSQNTPKVRTRRKGPLIDVDGWSRCYALNAVAMINGSMIRRLRRGSDTICILNNLLELLPHREYKMFSRRCHQALSPKKSVEEGRRRDAKDSVSRRGRRRGKIELEALLGEKEDLFSLDEEELFKNGARCFYIVRRELEFALQTSLRSFVREDRPEFIELQSALGLNKTEADLLKLSFVFNDNERLEDILREFHDKLNSEADLRLIGKLIGSSPSKLRAALGRKSKLSALELLKMNPGNRRGCIDFELDEQVEEYLGGLSKTSFSARFFSIQKESSFALSDFQLPKQKLDLMLKLLRSPRPCKILLYGAPGTGKTELAKSLTKAARLEGHWVKQSEEDELTNLRLALTTTKSQLRQNRDLLVLDEADEFLKASSYFPFRGDRERTSSKAWLNHFLDHSPSKMLWIANDIRGVEPSVLRRFTYSMQFKQFTRFKRIAYIRKLRAQSPLKKYLSDDFVQELAQYEVNVDAIASALQSCQAFYKEKGKGPSQAKLKELQKDLREILSEQHRLLQKKKIYKGSRIKEKYDPSVIRVDTPLAQLQSNLKNFIGSLSSAKEQGEGPAQMNLLFYGASGTGKSAFAQHLSEELGCELITKRASDLLGPFVGMTEMLIRAAFEEAEESQGILLIDEADSFLHDRRNNQRNWESTMTNEFLATMENYRGILICTSNLNENMDSACARRFHWKVKFLPLSPEGKLILFNRYFGSQFTQPLGSKEKNALSQIRNLSPGDFRAVWNRMGAFTKGARESGDNSAFENLLSELKKEAKYREGPKATVGFC